MSQEPTKPTANTMEEIKLYAQLANPKPMEKKPETGTRNDLEADYHEVPAGLDQAPPESFKEGGGGR